MTMLKVPEDTSTPIVEVARIATLTHRDGSSIIVAVKDAGNGPAVDIRQWLPPKDGYRTRTGAVASKPGMFTRRGWWLEPHVAEALVDALAEATVLAQSLQKGEL